MEEPLRDEVASLRRLVASQQRVLRRLESRQPVVYRRSESGTVLKTGGSFGATGTASSSSRGLSEELNSSDEEEGASSGASSKQRSLRPEAGLNLVSIRECNDDEESVQALAGDERLYRLYCDVKEGVTNPSIFLIKSLTVARNSWRLDGLLVLVTFFQAWFRAWFACVVLTRRNFSLLAPGFHKESTGRLKVRWLHRFAIDVSIFSFLGYISWSTWQQRQLHIFRFYLRSDSHRVRKHI